MKVRTDILRVYKSLHTWVGICAGMLLFIGFFAGALIIFKQPLERWASAPAQDSFLNSSHHFSSTNLDKLVSEIVQKYPQARNEFTLHLIQNEQHTTPASWSAEESGHELLLTANQSRAWINDAGELQLQEQVPSLLIELIDMLHRTAGIPALIGGEYLGTYLMGIAAVMYFLALVSGVILLLPTLVKDFFALRAGKNRKRFWLDAHNVIGIASLPYHIVISLTVIVFAFHDQFYDSLAEVVYREQPMFGSPPAKPTQTYTLEDLIPASQLLEKLQQEAPEFTITEMRYMGLETPRATVRAAVVSPRHMVQGAASGFVMINPYSGDITNNSMLPGKQNIWSQLITPFFALHFGSYGGDLVRWVYFLLGVSGAFVFYSGNLLWIESRRKQQKNSAEPVVQRRAPRLMAAATVGICLGAVAGVCTTLAATKWLHLLPGNINLSYLSVYYSVFLAAIVWAFWRGAGRASVHTLWLCAFTSLSIPLTSWCAIIFPEIGIWWHASTITVDLTAFVFALLFAYAAHKTLQRIATNSDSVWTDEKNNGEKNKDGKYNAEKLEQSKPNSEVQDYV